MKRTSVLLFDLGGCLVDTAGLDWLRSLRDDTAPGGEAPDGQAMRDRWLSSHLMGAIKPDKEAFEAVMVALRVAPGDIRFFDDSRANVESAERLGISAFLVDGLAGVRAALASEGLL